MTTVKGVYNGRCYVYKYLWAEFPVAAVPSVLKRHEENVVLLYRRFSTREKRKNLSYIMETFMNHQIVKRQKHFVSSEERACMITSSIISSVRSYFA